MVNNLVKAMYANSIAIQASMLTAMPCPAQHEVLDAFCVTCNWLFPRGAEEGFVPSVTSHRCREQRRVSAPAAPVRRGSVPSVATHVGGTSARNAITTLGPSQEGEAGASLRPWSLHCC